MRRIERDELPEYQARLAALEKLATYPLGNDRFQIDHGHDYFRFFERLGTLYYYGLVEKDELRAVGAGILRTVPFRTGDEPKKCWYGADLKVHPEHRGKRSPLSMAYKVFLPTYFRCRRGYGISMNPGDGSENRVIRNLSNFKLVKPDISHLELYSLDAEQMRACEPLVIEQRGAVSYLSLAGIKDIVLESTGKPMPLLHVQFGPCAEPGLAKPVDDSVHMFCTPTGDQLSKAMAARGLKPSATATIMSSGMKDSDWRFILTSDI